MASLVLLHSILPVLIEFLLFLFYSEYDWDLREVHNVGYPIHFIVRQEMLLLILLDDQVYDEDLLQ